MNIGKFEVNKCYFEDCVAAMTRIPPHSIDLCLTDLPYNINIGTSYPREVSRNKGLNHDVHYDDNMSREEYRAFCESWFAEAKRTCKHIIFTPGDNNIAMWYDIETPVGILYHYKKNANTPGTISRFIFTDVILIYGKWDRMQYFRKNVYDIPLRTKSSDPFLASLIHPCPKSYELWQAILDDYMHPVYGDLTIPNVVIDPFLGSGTTAELCEAYELKWIGFEMKNDYAVDIEKRISRGKERIAKRKRGNIF